MIAWHDICSSPHIGENLNLKKGGEIMDIFKRLMVEEEGQNIVEYTLMIGLVVLIIWVAISTFGIDKSVQSIWSNVNGQLSSAAS
jgi:Flp pilus assembly pilin Flp